MDEALLKRLKEIEDEPDEVEQLSSKDLNNYGIQPDVLKKALMDDEIMKTIQRQAFKNKEEATMRKLQYCITGTTIVNSLSSTEYMYCII